MLIFRLSGEVGWDITPADIESRLANASEDILVNIFSPGGNVFDGVEIHNMFKAYRGGKVTMVVGAEACSIATYIALAGDELHAYDNSAFMIHNASSGVWGDAKSMRQRADVLEMVNSLLIDRYVSKTQKSRDEIQAMMDVETYFFGQAIKDNGFADVIIESGTTAKSEDVISAAKDAVLECGKNCKLRPKKDMKGFIEALSVDMIKNEFADEVNNIMEKM